MTRIHLTMLAAGAVFAAAPLAAAVPQYDVRLIVDDGGAAPATPRLLVNAGSSARFMSANRDYAISVTATPAADGRVDVRSEVSIWTPDGLHNDASTITVAADGAPSTLLAPHADPASGRARPMRIEISVRPAAD